MHDKRKNKAPSKEESNNESKDQTKSQESKARSQVKSRFGSTALTREESKAPSKTTSSNGSRPVSWVRGILRNNIRPADNADSLVRINKLTADNKVPQTIVR